MSESEAPDRVCSNCQERQPIEDFPLTPPGHRILRGRVCLGCLIAYADGWHTAQKAARRRKNQRNEKRRKERHRERAVAREDAQRRQEERERKKKEQKRECERKAAYPSQEEAVETAARWALRTHRPLTTYRCRFCRLWHLTAKVRTST